MKNLRKYISKLFQRHFPASYQWLLSKWKYRKANIQNHTNLLLHPSVSIGRFSSIKFGQFPSVTDQTYQYIDLRAHVKLRNNVQLTVLSYDRLTIKDYTAIHDNCMIIGTVTIEKYNVLSANIYLSSGNHYADYQPYWLIKDQDQAVLNQKDKQLQHSKKIHIEEDCWLGWGVFVKRGVYIGRGSIIGAYTVVTKDVLPYQIQVGSPNKTIKTRLDFEPPVAIHPLKDEHLPYFYRGFAHKQFELQQSRHLNGIFVEQESLVCLKKINAQTLILKGQLIGTVTSAILFLQWNDHHYIKKEITTTESFEWCIDIKDLEIDTSKNLDIPMVLKAKYNWIYLDIKVIKSTNSMVPYPVCVQQIISR